MQLDPSRAERNPYQFAAGNPILYTDPSGLCYGPLFSIYRDIFPGWCKTVDEANLILGSPQTSFGEKVAAFSWIAASGLGQGLGVAATAVMVVLNPVGVATGASFGIAISGAYASIRYEFAKRGACGCAAKEWADSISDPNEYIKHTILVGGVVGGFAGGTVGLGSWGQAGYYAQGAMALVGIAAGTQGAWAAGQDIAENNIEVRPSFWTQEIRSLSS